MRAERAPRPEEIVLGPLDVAANAAEIAGFAKAIGAPAAEALATFPIVWLSSPELKAALRAVVGPDYLPVHESQSFAYACPLAPGGAYRLTAVARRESAPERLVVDADVVETSGAPVVTMRAVLRLAPLSGEPAA